jgi:hypothetical protein
MLRGGGGSATTFLLRQVQRHETTSSDNPPFNTLVVVGFDGGEPVDVRWAEDRHD